MRARMVRDVVVERARATVSAGGRGAVRLAAGVVDLERTQLGDRVRLRLRVEPVAAHLAAEPERGVVDGRAVGERALVQAGDAAVA